MSRIISSHGLYKHVYADDTQLYCALKHTQHNLNNLVCRMARYITAIRDWMKHNFPKSNDDKTEVMVIGSALQLEQKMKLDIGTVPVTVSAFVRNLGVLQDTHTWKCQFRSARCVHQRISTLPRFAPTSHRQQRHNWCMRSSLPDWIWGIPYCMDYLTLR